MSLLLIIRYCLRRSTFSHYGNSYSHNSGLPVVLACIHTFFPKAFNDKPQYFLSIFTSYYLQDQSRVFLYLRQCVSLKSSQMDVDACILSEFLVVSQCFIILWSSGSDLLPTCEVTVCTNESSFTPNTDSVENSEFFSNSGKTSLKLKDF